MNILLKISQIVILAPLKHFFHPCDIFYSINSKSFRNVLSRTPEMAHKSYITFLMGKYGFMGLINEYFTHRGLMTEIVILGPLKHHSQLQLSVGCHKYLFVCHNFGGSISSRLR